MAAFGAIDVPTRDVGYFRKALQDLEASLSEATARRGVILEEKAKAMAAIDRGDRRAGFTRCS
jgi:hypothetical protein